MSAPLCRVHCRLDRLRHNVELLRASGKPLMPVVKADAYGHGMVEVSRVLSDEGVTHLAVGAMEEAAELRQSGFGGEIVALLGVVSDSDLAIMGEYRVTPLIHNIQGLDRVAEATAVLPGAASLMSGGSVPASSVPIAVKCDTGMARLGFRPEDMPAVVERLRSAPHLRPACLLSHLAVADVPDEDEYTFAQARRFNEAARVLRAVWPDICLSLGNSACLLAFPELVGDLARPGLALYGGNPLFGTSRAILGAGLEPVMEAAVPVLSVHALSAGESLGYGRTYVAPFDRRVAWVGIGYADGFRRNPGAGACMTLQGRRAPIIGRVAMQMTCLDITHLSREVDVRPGDEALLLGGDGHAVSLQELADWWGTIPYEVTCLLGRNRTA